MQKQINNAAIAYAQERLGKDQFSKNKLAVKAISEDFKAGTEYILKEIKSNFEAIELLKKIDSFISSDPKNAVSFNSQIQIEIKSILSREM